MTEPSNWDEALLLLVVTLISLGAEYVRRQMPPPRHQRDYRREDET